MNEGMADFLMMWNEADKTFEIWLYEAKRATTLSQIIV